MTNDLSPIWLSLKCALLSALLTVPWGLCWGWLLARKSFRGKLLLQTCLYIPLVLPPVLTGFLLVSLLGKNAWLGKSLYELFRIRFTLDWKGAVLAASVVSSPFMVQMIKSAIENVDCRLEKTARSLGVGPGKAFWTITFPLSWPGIIAGFFLVFARSLGEFGATIMLAGNIPGKTQTIPLAIYSKVHLGQETAIVPLVIFAFGFSYAGLWLSQWFYQRKL